MKFIVGLLLGLALVPLGAYFYFTGGSAPVATTDSDLPFEKFLAHKALDARIAKDVTKNVPIQLTEANYVAGAELYKQQLLHRGLSQFATNRILAGAGRFASVALTERPWNNELQILLHG